METRSGLLTPGCYNTAPSQRGQHGGGSVAAHGWGHDRLGTAEQFDDAGRGACEPAVRQCVIDSGG